MITLVVDRCAPNAGEKRVPDVSRKGDHGAVDFSHSAGPGKEGERVARVKVLGALQGTVAHQPGRFERGEILKLMIH